MFKYRNYFTLAVLLCGIALMLCSACSNRKAVVPVEGKVLYKGKPLEFGSVLFQPEQGPMARSEIAADGSFRLTTYTAGDGAVVGEHRVQIVCCEAQRPESELAKSGEAVPGPSYIPIKYRRLDSSGLRAEIKSSGNEPIVFELQ